jgi:hypothetical protein
MLPESAMSSEHEQADALSLRAGAALAGYDLEALWLDCVIIGGGHLRHNELIAAVSDEGTESASARNLVGMAINRRLMRYGISPLFPAAPIIDVNPD